MGDCFPIPLLKFNSKLFYGLTGLLRLLSLTSSLIILSLTIEHQILPTPSEQCFLATVILTPILQFIWTILVLGFNFQPSWKEITAKNFDIVFHISGGFFVIIASILYLVHAIGFNLYCKEFRRKYPIPKHISSTMNHKKYLEYSPLCFGFGDVHGMNSLRILSGVFCLVNGMMYMTIGFLIHRTTDMFVYRRHDNQTEDNTALGAGGTGTAGAGQDDAAFVGGNGLGRLPQFVIDNEQREYLDLTGNLTNI